ncbi:MAG TPA: diguanylate cyclase [Usitatibacter sp.]|nr:diguanylate cyclase [Usitatibacter sp.]
MTLSPNDHDFKLAAPWNPGPRASVTMLMLLLPAVLLLEWLSGQGFSLSVFYLCPIALGAWTFGRNVGFGLAALSAAYSSFVAFNTLGPGAPVSEFYIQSGSTLGIFVLFAFVVAHHRRFIDVMVVHGRVDAESGALSRREFENVLRVESARATRYKRPFALALVELAGTKDEDVTARRLESITAMVRQNVHEADSFARLDGGKLALLMVERSAADANAIVGRISGLLRQRFQGKLEVRVGLASYMGRGPVSPNKLMQAAGDQLRAGGASNKGALVEAIVL